MVGVGGCIIAMADDDYNDMDMGYVAMLCLLSSFFGTIIISID